ncbi:glycosyltransferase family 2 protein [Rhizobium helianthi]|uniref:Glycosyltransferase family 2 protein n=1 Tax=Rhizobium helianthi TaxID=1132695 RepID=A0ABW4M344_9HYPH
MDHPIKLSICIPTYNRAHFLERLLGLIADEYRFPFSYEVVISDDCSKDNTAEVAQTFADRGLPVVYRRCTRNVGYEKNLLSALHLARGELIIYLGDDDQLIAEGVVDAVRYMDAHPETSVCYTPSITRNEVAGTNVGQSFVLQKDHVFQRGDFDGALKFILRQHIFPETGIYRASALRSVWTSRLFCYWAFAYLAHFLDHGAITFRSNPFYVAITESVIARDRPPAGEEEVMRAWDRYRGGLDYMLYLGQRRGSISSKPEVLRSYALWIEEFTTIRMTVAARFWVAARDFVRAFELLTRINAFGHGTGGEAQHLMRTVPQMAAIQTLAHIANSVAGITDVIIHSFPNAKDLGQHLRNLGLDAAINIRSIDLVRDDEKLDSMVVLFLKEEERELFLTAGFSPGLLFSEADLLSTVVV